MTNDTVERAIEKATAPVMRPSRTRPFLMKGTVPAAVAIMAIALTDNRNRTAAEVRYAFSRHGGSLGETGSVGWQFEPLDRSWCRQTRHDADEIALQAIDAGATDVVDEDGRDHHYHRAGRAERR